MRISDWSSDVGSSDLRACKSRALLFHAHTPGLVQFTASVRCRIRRVKKHFHLPTPRCGLDFFRTGHYHAGARLQPQSVEHRLPERCLNPFRNIRRDVEIRCLEGAGKSALQLAFFKGSLQNFAVPADPFAPSRVRKSEEHTSELQSLMRISYAVFCLKKKKQPAT